MLGNLQVWLDKAQAHAEARKFDPNNYLGLRLAPDMLPSRRADPDRQRHRQGLHGAAWPASRCPKWEDNEATLADLRARVAEDDRLRQVVHAAQIDGSEGREISIPRRSGDPLKFNGESYLKHYALPNFFFHVTTAYALLRHAGVEIGKGDYLGGR